MSYMLENISWKCSSSIHMSQLGLHISFLIMEFIYGSDILLKEDRLKKKQNNNLE